MEEGNVCPIYVCSFYVWSVFVLSFVRSFIVNLKCSRRKEEEEE